MKDGFIKVAAVTPEITVADTEANVDRIILLAEEAEKSGAKIIVFPELCITGYTCQDLFWQGELLAGALEGLERIREASRKLDALIFVGLPLEVNGKLYNTAAAVSRGSVLGIVPKRELPNYNEFYEGRHFTPGQWKVVPLQLNGEEVPFGIAQLFAPEDHRYLKVPSQLRINPLSGSVLKLKVAVEICEDLWVTSPPSIRHAMAGANVIVNLSASDALAGKSDYLKTIVTGQSGRLVCGYIYASAGEGESSQDLVFSGHRLIAENGKLLGDAGQFTTGILYSELDIDRLNCDRRRMNTFHVFADAQTGNGPVGMDSGRELVYRTTSWPMGMEETVLTRRFERNPFVPENEELRKERCEEILNIQALALKKRLSHINCRKAVLGISGGLDSTLALLVTSRAFDLLGIGRENIICITMPGFGTTDRTYDNACRMSRVLGADLREISIRDAVLQHFKDIGQDPQVHDVTYENSQARERTQILMDIANQVNGIVVGTGDLSELALGWATYNGDHMSMYAVNSSIPKTLVRYLVRYYADFLAGEELAGVLRDVLDTPVSPELLPPKDGKIAQITEDLVGPYELHDFFLYQVLRFGFSPMKILRMACLTFEGVYPREVILKWLKTFYWRFFSQQYKRSCVPDGPKVGSIALSPRGDLRMPSDASVRIWRRELDTLS